MIVSFFSYPDGIPGDGQTWFAVVRSYSVSVGLAVGDAKLGCCGLLLSLRSGPTLWGPVLQSVVYPVIVVVFISGRTSCGLVLQWLVQSWVDAVWSSSLLSGPTLCGLVPQWFFCVVIVSIVFIDPGDTPGGSQTLFVVRS